LNFYKENEHFIQNNSRLIFDNFSKTFMYDQYFSSEVSLIFLNFCYRNYICRNLSILLEFLDFSSRSLKFLEIFLFKFNKVSFYFDCNRSVKSNNFYLNNNTDSKNLYSSELLKKIPCKH